MNTISKKFDAKTEGYKKADRDGKTAPESINKTDKVYFYIHIL